MTIAQRETATTKEYPYEPDPPKSVFLQRVTLQANEEKDLPLISTRVVFFFKMLAFGTNVGDVSMAIGERGDFFELAPGDKIEMTRFSQVRFKNNTGFVKSFAFLHTDDSMFNFENFSRGL
jgi:hypothetical protein